MRIVRPRIVRIATLLALTALLLGGALVAVAAGPPFPDPVVDQSVYDEPGVLSPQVEQALERGIDAIEARSGAETVIYIQVDPSATGDSNLEAARALMDQWGIGREGFNDGFVILLSFQPDLLHGQLSTFAGEGFLVAYLSEDDQSRLRNDVIVPAILSGQVEAGMLLAVEFVDAAVTT